MHITLYVMLMIMMMNRWWWWTRRRRWRRQQQQRRAAKTNGKIISFSARKVLARCFSLSCWRATTSWFPEKIHTKTVTLVRWPAQAACDEKMCHQCVQLSSVPVKFNAGHTFCETKKKKKQRTANMKREPDEKTIRVDISIAVCARTSAQQFAFAWKVWSVNE